GVAPVLALRVQQRGDTVVPVFRVLNPKGEDKGHTAGPAVATQEWANAAPELLDRTARAAAPKISSLLTSIQTTAMHADPNSLYNRIAKVQVAAVTGAPGDGNTALTTQLK